MMVCALSAALVWLVRQAGKRFSSKSWRRITVESVKMTSRKAASGPVRLRPTPRHSSNARDSSILRSLASPGENRL